MRSNATMAGSQPIDSTDVDRLSTIVMNVADDYPATRYEVICINIYVCLCIVYMYVL